MITYISGDLFQSPARVLVNTVNTVGVMGKGIAKEFKFLFPEMFSKYRELCESQRLQIGNLFLYKTPNKWVLNFPTKKHWRQPAHPEYIEKGLQKLVSIYEKTGIYSVAMPLLGCGNGELDWPTQVQPIVEQYMKKLPIHVFVYHHTHPQSLTPEHQDISAMEEWLRKEPEHLPFAEVWEDLSRLLKNKQRFCTLASNSNTFNAQASFDPKGIRIESKANVQFVDYSDLFDFWQQLRSYGFTSRQIAPSGLSRKSYYLMPVFAELEYVTPARLSDSYERLQNGSDTIGLQYHPNISLNQANVSRLHLVP